jgi:twitching motility protein PilT
VLDFGELLRRVVGLRASDLHLKAGSPPIIRMDGRLEVLNGDELTPADTAALARELIPEHRRSEWDRFHEVDFAHGVAGLGRFRVTVFSQRGSVALAIRHILPGTPSFEALGLPAAIARLCTEQQGLILVTGPAGSGKTTTVAAMIDRVNEADCRHIVTIEDPIEFLHRDKRSVVSQREIGSDSPGYATALRRVMRQDPDVVFVGELHDRDTARAAITLANTNRLVVSTMVTPNVVQTVEWLLNVFGPDEQAMARSALARCVKGIVSQQLLERTDGRGRVPVVEVLVNQSRVTEFFLGDPAAQSIEQTMAEGEFYGMQTFDQSLFQLCKEGLVGVRTAITASEHPHELRASLQSLGLPISALDM